MWPFLAWCVAGLEAVRPTPDHKLRHEMACTASTGPVMSNDPFNLARFVVAQSAPEGTAGTAYECAVADLRTGHWHDHWTPFLLPQLRSLGYGEAYGRYGLNDLQEALAYWDHPTLGPRLRHLFSVAIDASEGGPAVLAGLAAIKGQRSCLTLFLRVAPEDALLSRALARFYRGKPCRKTLAHLERSAR
ncbi:MAG: DUF1810 family protein [Proteobacteria bacterium]|nr:DUF1810 family protein [Pseudomonadota bacterium]